MNQLYKNLQNTKTEEDVKDVYIKALGLKSYTKGLVDIRTDEIWFEAKDKGTISTYAMFTQLLHYVQVDLNKGETLPPFLCVIDTKKAALMKTSDVLPFLRKKTIKWGKSASQYSKAALDEVSTHIGTYFVSYRIETHGEEFIHATKRAIKEGDIIRAQITPDNLKQVFDKWVDMIGREIKGIEEENYALLFYADVMSDGTYSTHEDLPAELLHKGNKPIFSLWGNNYELGSLEGYRRFWAIYHRPPKEEYRKELLERRDSLIPLDERSFKGAYFTPLHVVEKAYDKLTESLGKNWQKNYIVWDMCCGVGNLETKHSNLRKVFMSTLDQADVDVMKATKTCVAATRFQYDYLNDDIDDSGNINYGLTNKVPQSLRDAIEESKTSGKKFLVLINPPYAESGSGISKGDTNKIKVEQTQINTLMKSQDLGYATKELFVQFLARIAKELPTATIAIFSKMKYVNAPNFEKFRQNWNAKYMGGFIVHSKSFDGLKGNFPIGFLIWKTNQESRNKTPITTIEVDILNKAATPIGSKLFYNLPKETFLNVWLEKPKTNDELALPLANAVKISNNPRMKKSCNGMLGFLYASNNDLQHAGKETLISSSIYTGGNGGGLYIVPENLEQAAIVFSVRRLIKPTWVNDRDQFLQPTGELAENFKNDCLIWMLFSGSNLTASANGLEWNNKTWSLVNHFIPFTEDEVNSSDRFESDFMVCYLKGRKLSKEAMDVLDAGRSLWQAYFSKSDVHTVRAELKLNRADVGWYQIRNALKRRNESGDDVAVNFGNFETAYRILSEKLVPMVYDLGFLRP